MKIAKTLEFVGLVLMVSAGLYGHHCCLGSAAVLLGLAVAAVQSALGV